MRSFKQQTAKALCPGFFALMSGLVAQAEAAVPDIPPAMLAQLKNMSPSEQAALARQYGIELPAGPTFEGKIGSQMWVSPGKS